jgi:hypothetical protein
MVALECLELIEQGFLSTGWIQFRRVRLAGRDLDVILTGWLSNFWRRLRLGDGLALCWLDMVKIGWLLASLR